VDVVIPKIVVAPVGDLGPKIKKLEMIGVFDIQTRVRRSVLEITSRRCAQHRS
jgi:hypothetical protein